MARSTVERMWPSDLRYTHDSVSCRFSDGCDLEETFRQILYDEISVDSLPRLEAMPYENEWFVVRGNRRLYIYKILESIGKISEVNVKCIPFKSYLFNRQYSSENSGQNLRIRGNPQFAEDLKRITRSWEISIGRRQNFVYDSQWRSYSNNRVRPESVTSLLYRHTPKSATGVQSWDRLYRRTPESATGVQSWDRLYRRTPESATGVQSWDRLYRRTPESATGVQSWDRLYRRTPESATGVQSSDRSYRRTLESATGVQPWESIHRPTDSSGFLTRCCKLLAFLLILAIFLALSNIPDKSV